MKIVLTGRGVSGSWSIRGDQLGTQMEVDIVVDIQRPKGYDLAVIVKRPRMSTVEILRKAGVPIVWDVVDSWPQPHGNTWGRDLCMQWLATSLEMIKPVAVVAATHQMEEDLKPFGLPTLWLPHHARPNQPINPVREKILKVGYQGGANYLGYWEDFLRRVCEQKGYEFVLQPKYLAELDVVVALRSYEGYATRNWKSNVKVANAQGTGTPVIAHPEKGATELATGAECWVDSEGDILRALSLLAPQKTRQRLSKFLLDGAPKLEDLAVTYKTWLEGLSI